MMSEIADKMRDSVNSEMNEENAKEVDEPNKKVNEAEVPAEPTEIEAIASDSGWKEGKEDRDGNSLTAKEYMDRKPLFNRIRNQGEQLTEMREMLKEIKADNLKIAQQGQKENERLLAELEAEKEKHLDNFDADEIRRVDKAINIAKENIADTPVSNSPPYKENPDFKDFLKDNEWASDEDHPLTMAAESIARRYIAKHGENTNDKEMYEHIHTKIRKDYPEKFDVKPRVTNKVASSKNRSTTNYNSKKEMTLSDIPDDATRRIVENMARQTKKTVEEYLKNYTPDDFK